MSKSAKDCALTLLDFRPRTCREMSGRLKEKGYPPEEIEETLHFLESYHFLDDGDYARNYIRSAAQKKSVLQIRVYLEQKGVDRAVIDAALEKEPVDEVWQVRSYLEKKAACSGEVLDAAFWQKQAGALARKGFPVSMIRRIMDEVRREFGVYFGGDAS